MVRVAGEDQGAWLAPPVVPREHGGWVVLACSAGLGFGLGHHLAAETATALVVCALAAVMLREQLRRAVSKRRTVGDIVWSALFSLVALGAGSLLLPYAAGLWPIAAAASILAVTHLAITVGLFGRRLDRTTSGELLGCWAVCLLASAGAIVSGGSAWGATWGFLACAGYFGASVLRVRHILAAYSAAKRGAIRPAWPMWLVQAASLAASVVAASCGASVGIALIAVLPAGVCAFYISRRNPLRLPVFKKLGLLEAALAIWFVCWAAFGP